MCNCEGALDVDAVVDVKKIPELNGIAFRPGYYTGLIQHPANLLHGSTLDLAFNKTEQQVAEESAVRFLPIMTGGEPKHIIR